jgi:hypothetical protein
MSADENDMFFLFRINHGSEKKSLFSLNIADRQYIGTVVKNKLNFAYLSL